MDKQTLLAALNNNAEMTSEHMRALQAVHEQHPFFEAVADVLMEKGMYTSPWPSDPFRVARRQYKETPWETAVDDVGEPVSPPEASPVVIDEPAASDDILQLINSIPLHSEITLDTLPVVPPAPEEPKELEPDLRDKSLMVMMSFTDWLNYYKVKQLKEKEEAESKKALNASWQKEKLAAAVEEDVEDEVPEAVFKQAMASISTETGIISESLAKLLAEQGKTDRAIAMYKKLSLRNPEKSSYFARLIEQLSSKTH